MEGEDELYEKHLPFYTPPTIPDSVTISHTKSKRTRNTLDLVQPPDLQKFGLIPELVGRLPITCALSSLSISLWKMQKYLMYILGPPLHAHH